MNEVEMPSTGFFCDFEKDFMSSTTSELRIDVNNVDTEVELCGLAPYRGKNGINSTHNITGGDQNRSVVEKVTHIMGLGMLFLKYLFVYQCEF